MDDHSHKSNEQKAASLSGLSALSPGEVLKSAISAVPAVKWALGVAGVAACVAIVAGFRLDYRVAILGTVIMLVMMFVLVIFAAFARIAGKHLRRLALTLAWSCVLLTIATAFFIVSGFFFSWPRPLDQIAGDLVGSKKSPTPSTTPSPVNALRLLNYSILVCKVSDPHCRKPFPLAGEINFEKDYRIKLNISSPQAGYLYLLNQGPLVANALPQYVLLFPTLRMNGGSAGLNEGMMITIPNDNWLRFDQEEGKEKLFVVWSMHRVAAFEDVARNVMLRPEDKGAITEPASIFAVKEFLQASQSAPQPEVVRNEEINQTTVKTAGDLLVFSIKLEHH